MKTKLNNIIIKATPELMKEIRARVNDIKKENNQTPFGSFGNLFSLAHRAVNDDLFHEYHTGKETCPAKLNEMYIEIMSKLIATDDEPWFYGYAQAMASQKKQN